MKTKAQILQEKLAEADTLEAKLKTDEGNTPENQKAFADLVDEIATVQTEAREEAKKAQTLSDAKSFLNEPANQPKSVAITGGFQPATVNPRNPIIQTVGAQFVESDDYKKLLGKSRGPNTRIQIEAKGVLGPQQLKATFDSSSTGQETYYNYQAGPILVEQQRLTIRDLLATGQTTLSSIPYIKETSFTNSAATVAEEGEKPEASFALEDALAPVRKIAVIARVTDEMWNDYPMLRDYINSRLRFMVEQEEEDQILNGAGTGSELTGLLNTSGIQTQALSTNIHETAYKAMTKIRSVGFFEPTGFVFHPNDWEAVRLAKDGQNQYYGGGPFMGPYGNGGIASDSLWGKPVVVTTAIAEGTGLCGAFKLGAQIWQREGITVEATNSHEDDFQFNRMAIRVEERLALAVYRPKAFCTLTGI